MPEKKRKSHQRNGSKASVKMPRSSRRAWPDAFGQTSTRDILIGAAVIAAGAAATGAVFAREGLGKLVAAAAADAVEAGQTVGSFGGRIGKTVSKSLDVDRLLASIGLGRRPSLIRRLLPPIGALAAVVAAAGSALFLLMPRLAAATEEKMAAGKSARYPQSGEEDVADTNSVTSVGKETAAHAVK